MSSNRLPHALTRNIESIQYSSYTMSCKSSSRVINILFMHIKRNIMSCTTMTTHMMMVKFS
jgi:hypothetical protein